MRLGGFADVERDFVLKRHDDRECERSLSTMLVKTRQDGIIRMP